VATASGRRRLTKGHQKEKSDSRIVMTIEPD